MKQKSTFMQKYILRIRSLLLNISLSPNIYTKLVKKKKNYCNTIFVYSVRECSLYILHVGGPIQLRCQ